MDTNMLLPLTVEIATITILLVAIGALISIIKMTDGKLLHGWRLMLVAFFIAMISEMVTVAYITGIMKHPYQAYVHFIFSFVGLVALWQMAKTFDETRTQVRGR